MRLSDVIAGMRSIAEGMATFTLFPARITAASYEGLYRGMRSDRDKVMDDLEKAIDGYEEQHGPTEESVKLRDLARRARREL